MRGVKVLRKDWQKVCKRVSQRLRLLGVSNFLNEKVCVLSFRVKSKLIAEENARGVRGT